MSDFVNTIDLLGDQATADAIISKTITEFKDDVVDTISQSRFRGCSRLTTVDLPNLVTLSGDVFNSCTNLVSVNVPKLKTSIKGGNGAFSKCTSLKTIVLPELVSIVDGGFFASCSSLEMVDLPKATSIGSSTFADCSKLNTLVLREIAVCSLSNTSAFHNVSKTVTVYVPYDWIDAYENATNWSSLVASGKVTFEALEGSGYD